MLELFKQYTYLRYRVSCCLYGIIDVVEKGAAF